MKSGFFVTFEGIDGTGKTTQLERLAVALEREGWALLVTREPGGTRLGQNVREWLLAYHECPVSQRAELFLYLAARAQHVEEVIQPALQRGQVVLCSRFSDSTLAYQAGGLGLGWRQVRWMDRFATAGLQPDFTVLLDLPPEVGQRRVAGRGADLDRIESRQLLYHQRVREAFLRLAQREPERFLVLSATDNADRLHQQIRSALVERLVRRGLRPVGKTDCRGGKAV